jgi:hypothetical protein
VDVPIKIPPHSYLSEIHHCTMKNKKNTHKLSKRHIHQCIDRRAGEAVFNLPLSLCLKYITHQHQKKKQKDKHGMDVGRLAAVQCVHDPNQLLPVGRIVATQTSAANLAKLRAANVKAASSVTSAVHHE